MEKTEIIYKIMNILQHNLNACDTRTFMRFIGNVLNILCIYFHEPNRVIPIRDYRLGWISECYHD